MKIYIVKVIDEDNNVDYDEYDGVVVVAQGPANARLIASEYVSRHGAEKERLKFRDPKQTSVKEVKPETAKRGVILGSFNAG